LFQIDAEITEKAASLVSNEAGFIRDHNVVGVGQGIRDGNRKPAGHMAVTGAGKP
jgi:hypothetical protein